MARINYDQISKRYDERYRVNRFEGVTTTLLDFVAATRAHDVLEVGCGTGRWITDLPAEAAEGCGLDLSLGMLRKAHEKSTNLSLRVAPLPSPARQVFSVNDDKVFLGIDRHPAPTAIIEYIREPHLIGSFAVFVRADNSSIYDPNIAVIPNPEILERFRGCGWSWTGMKPLDAVHL